MSSATTADVLLILIAILFPPASAAILTGCSCALFVNILLTLLGYIPGHLHAFWLIYKKIQADERYGPQGSVYVSQGVYQPIGAPLPEHHHRHHQHPHAYHQTGQQSGQGELYGGQQNAAAGYQSGSGAVGGTPTQQQQQHPADSKGAPPPYGAV